MWHTSVATGSMNLDLVIFNIWILLFCIHVLHHLSCVKALQYNAGPLGKGIVNDYVYEVAPVINPLIRPDTSSVDSFKPNNREIRDSISNARESDCRYF